MFFCMHYYEEKKLGQQTQFVELLLSSLDVVIHV